MSIWVIFFILQSFLYLQLPPNSWAQWSLLDATVHQFPASEFESPPHRRRNHAWTPSPSRDLNNGNVHQQHHQQQQQQNIQFTNAKELQKKVKRPPSFANSNSREPLSVKLGFYLESLGDFRETQMSFEVDLYMYMSWRDSSLRHAGPDMVMINEDLVRRQLWVPDLYFANARQANFHEVTVPNFNLFISPDGTVAYSSRVTLTVACNLDLVDYPMDYQQCHIRVLSYAYIAKIVNVTWFRQSPIMYNPDIDLPEFEIDRIGAEYCDGTYRYAVTDRSSKTDRFSCLMGNLYLRRRIGFNMVQSYIPTGLIVIISWVSFWIDRRAVPARVTLSFTTLLTMTTIGNGMRFALPRVSYAKAIDFWFGGCMLFVFLALVEFALVNSYMRRSEKYERLAGKYKRRTSTTDLLTLSPILASELARSYAEMLKLRRKSSAFHLLDGVKKNFTSSPVLNKRKLAKESRDETSQSLSEDVSEQSKEKKSKKNGEEAEKKISMQENPAGTGKKAPAGQPAGNLNMDSSYYDNMHLSVNGHKKTLEQLPNGTVKRKVTPVKANSVVFAVDDADKAEEEEDEYLWPKVAEDGSKSNGELPEGKRSRVEPNPELYCKYLEASQLLSRRALNIDKASRILFPISFVLFNILYWGYYLVLRQRRIV